VEWTPVSSGIDPVSSRIDPVSCGIGPLISGIDPVISGIEPFPDVVGVTAIASVPLAVNYCYWCPLVLAPLLLLPFPAIPAVFYAAVGPAVDV
jgi:hypothetical protein